MRKRGALRTGYATMYFAAAMINTTLAVRSAGVVRGLSDYAYFGFLRRLIATAPDFLFVVALLSFAVYQLALGFLLLSRDRYRLGFCGGILFHLGILPFGPFNLLNVPLLVPLVLALRRPTEDRVTARWS